MTEINQQHLWEVEHPYYCSMYNYNVSGEPCTFDSWEDFYEEMGNADEDYNFLFRWDWNDSLNEDNEIEQDELKLAFMQQRKGKYVGMVVKVKKEDEPKVREYLEQKKKYMLEVWSF